VKSVCEDLDAFADGQLDAAEHERFAGHLVDCDDCAQGLEGIFVIGALADQVRADCLAREHRPDTRVQVTSSGNTPSWWLRRWLRNSVVAPRWLWATGLAVGGAALFLLFEARAHRAPAPDATMIAELQARPYRATEARLAAGAFSQYRPLSSERGREEKAVDALTTFRQQGLSALDARREFHLLGVVYLLGQQYARAGQALSAATETPGVLNDRAVLAYQQGRMSEALRLAERALSASPSHGPALWNKALALEGLGRIEEAARAFEDCAARGEVGWGGEAALRAQVLRAKAPPGGVPVGPP
jgi:hypothetical protein